MSRSGHPTVLTIAGTDPSGGAGISADLKTFSALGAYGTAVVTAVVAQSTRGVAAVTQLTAPQVRTQLDDLLDDVRVDAVKIGMLGTAEVIATVAERLAGLDVPVVLDPVMVAKSGDRLLQADAVAALRDTLLPVVDLVTPNLPEAADLLGEPEATSLEQMRAQVARLGGSTRGGVLLKGGHLGGAASTDLLLADGATREFSAARVATRNTHGTGCTLSAAIAALRPQRASWADAVADAKDYLTGALQHADELSIGHGHGPVHHFWQTWS